METEAINLSIRGHEESDVHGWEYSEIARALYSFSDIFNRELFEERLPVPAISFRPSRITEFGSYHIGRNELGLKDQINLNPEYLGRPVYETLATLLHEMIHQWQDCFGRHSSGYYHNRQFQTKSQELGIPCDATGRTIGITDPFVELCRRYGVEVPEHPMEESEPVKRPPGRSKLRKYTCGCTNIWAATEVHAICKACHNEFETQV